MNRSMTQIIVLGMVLGVWGGGTTTGFADDACHTAPPSPRQVYSQQKQQEIKQLQAQIQTVQAQLKSATDPSTKTPLRAQLHSLEEQKCEAMIDLAKHQVQWDQEDIDAAQKRLTAAQDRLAKLEAKEAEMNAKKM